MNSGNCLRNEKREQEETNLHDATWLSAPTTPFPFLCMEDGRLVLVPGASRSMSEPPLELLTILHLVLTLLAAPYPASIKSPGVILCSQLASSSCISVVTFTFVSRKPFLRTSCPKKHSAKKRTPRNP
jgi:hypothetical protein